MSESEGLEAGDPVLEEDGWILLAGDLSSTVKREYNNNYWQTIIRINYCPKKNPEVES